MSFNGGCEELYSVKGLAAAVFLVVSLLILYNAYHKEKYCGGAPGCTCVEELQSQPDPASIARDGVLSAVAAGF
jgi:hypothetical protein